MSRFDTDIRFLDKAAQQPLSERLATQSSQFRHCLELAAAAAASLRPVLITGESGVGKSLIAQFLHQQSPRRARPLVTLRCTGLHSGELRSRLFGHGVAKDQPPGGLLGKASGGSLLLKGVEQLSGVLQKELLNILKEYSRPAEEEEAGDAGFGRRLGVRILSTATAGTGDRNESEMFMEELLFALGEITLRVPPLRERREDMDSLTRAALEEANLLHGKMVRDLSHSAREFIQHYSFPGNVRELYNIIDQAVRLGGRDAIYVEDLGLVEDESPSDDPHVLSSQALLSLAEVEKRHINKALLRTGWKKNAAARILQISETMLNRKIKLYGLERGR